MIQAHVAQTALTCSRRCRASWIGDEHHCSHEAVKGYLHETQRDTAMAPREAR